MRPHLGSDGTHDFTYDSRGLMETDRPIQGGENAMHERVTLTPRAMARLPLAAML